MKSFKQHTKLLSEGNLIVSFKTKEMMFERIYERDLKSKFKKLFRSTKKTKPNASFDITFKGEEDELKKVTKYITGTLDKKNGIYDTHTISNVATKRLGEAKIYDPMYYDAGMDNDANKDKFIKFMRKHKLTVITKGKTGTIEVFPKEGSDKQTIFKAAKRYHMIAVKR